MSESIDNFDSYRIPSKKIRRNRKSFFDLKKKRDEPVKLWCTHVQNSIDGCAFGKLTEILLIDKFFCELNDRELESFQSTKTWTLQQLTENLFGHSIDTAWIDSGNAQNENDNDVLTECHEPQLDAVKYETVSISNIYCNCI